MSETDINNLDQKILFDISTEIFIKNWSIYRKIIENDNMSHRSGYSKLKEILLAEMDRPFSFLDLACGDAYYSSRTLRDTKAREYIGIDVSEQALSFAKEELSSAGFETILVNADFFDFDRIVRQPVDVIWVGFSVHHLDIADKLEFMKKARNSLSAKGLFLLYEPVLIEGENREEFLKRFRETYDRHWRGLNEEEEESLFEHVRESEKPETTEDWIKLGKNAGFTKAEKVYSENTGLYEIFKYG